MAIGLENGPASSNATLGTAVDDLHRCGSFPRGVEAGLCGNGRSVTFEEPECLRVSEHIPPIRKRVALEAVRTSLVSFSRTTA
jgi:hypothetical protein